MRFTRWVNIGSAFCHRIDPPQSMSSSVKVAEIKGSVTRRFMCSSSRHSKALRNGRIAVPGGRNMHSSRMMAGPGIVRLSSSSLSQPRDRIRRAYAKKRVQFAASMSWANSFGRMVHHDQAGVVLIGTEAHQMHRVGHRRTQRRKDGQQWFNVSHVLP